eukprot:TRINITY_DN475_c0_g3_i1.p1 TRINITY_DN475_c0_g3~~TRINITY_DN475_c0_g3_i1.p1  ORF type:complete len:696 (-),score=313.92 TRINITY_DN475_c0_g3_i1:94-2157(-)
MKKLHLILILILFFFGINSNESKRTFPSMILSDWSELAITWSGPRDNPNQQPIRSPGVTGLRSSSDWSKSALSVEGFAIRWGSTLFGDPTQWDGDVFIDNNGQFINLIETYSGVTIPFTMQRTYIVPPKQGFYMIQYTITNSFSNNEENLQLLDFVNTSPCPVGDGQWAWFNTGENLFMVDETKANCNQFYYSSAVYSKENFISYQIGTPTGSKSPLTQFINNPNGQLNQDQVYSGAQASIGFVFNTTLKPYESVSFSIYRNLQRDYNSAVSYSKKAVAQSPSYWVQQTAQSTQNWLSLAKKPSFNDAETERFYWNSLLLMKHSQNPTIGTFIASFHPAYLFKTWGRDAVFSAIIMAEAGYIEESQKFLKWMSTASLRSDGAFHTCYDWWTGVDVGFVEPQFDSAGAYLLAIYHDYKLTKNSQLANSVQQRVRNLENFFLNNIGLHSLAPPDYSIWEESSDPHTGAPLPTSYFTFTQSLAAAGLWAAAQLEKNVWSDTNRANQLLERSQQIVSAIETYLWSNDGYYIRAIWSNDSSLDTRVDSSSVAAVFLGLISDSNRAQSHIKKIQTNLTQAGAGIGRYWGDPFFYDSIYNPGGQEVGAPTPPWGVTTMFLSWAEIQYKISIDQRLSWMVQHAAPMGMAVGEAVDGVTGTFVMSSCPDLYEYAGVYIWGLLMNQGLAQFANPFNW